MDGDDLAGLSGVEDCAARWLLRRFHIPEVPGSNPGEPIRLGTGEKFAKMLFLRVDDNF